MKTLGLELNQDMLICPLHQSSCYLVWCWSDACAACLPASHRCRLLMTCSAPGTRSPGPALLPAPRTAQRPAPKIPAQEQQRETKPKSNTGETKSNQINSPEGKRRRRPPFPSICSTRSQRSIGKNLTLGGENKRQGKEEPERGRKGVTGTCVAHHSWLPSSLYFIPSNSLD
jgi:hypothetical protein